MALLSGYPTLVLLHLLWFYICSQVFPTQELLMAEGKSTGYMTVSYYVFQEAFKIVLAMEPFLQGKLIGAIHLNQVKVELL